MTTGYCGKGKHEPGALPTKPVRKIRGNARSITGRVGGNQIESALERDLATLLKFDPSVHRTLTQTVQVEYTSPAGLPASYTPDFLVEYKRDEHGNYLRPPRLCEVKYKKDLEENAAEYAPKFDAARSHCKDHGWTFEVLSEVEIRTRYLENARFLMPYRARTCDGTLTDAVLAWFRENPSGSPMAYLATLPGAMHLEALTATWHLLANRRLVADLNQRVVTNSTPLTVPQGEQ